MESDGIQSLYSTAPVIYLLYVSDDKKDNVYLPPDEKVDIFIVRTERFWASFAPPEEISFLRRKWLLNKLFISNFFVFPVRYLLKEQGLN
jgi:hypothetical protein